MAVLLDDIIVRRPRIGRLNPFDGTETQVTFGEFNSAEPISLGEGLLTPQVPSLLAALILHGCSDSIALIHSTIHRTTTIRPALARPTMKSSTDELARQLGSISTPATLMALQKPLILVAECLACGQRITYTVASLEADHRPSTWPKISPGRADEKHVLRWKHDSALVKVPPFVPA